MSFQTIVGNKLATKVLSQARAVGQKNPSCKAAVFTASRSKKKAPSPMIAGNRMEHHQLG